MSRLAVLAAALLVPTAALAAGEKVSYPSGGEQVQGYLALPQGKGPFPGLVIVPEWWGLNDWVRGKADEFAAKGYAALAVDIYRGQVAEDPDTAHQLARALPSDRAQRDLRAAFAYLAGRKDVDSRRVGVIGWCMGGGLALDLAQAAFGRNAFKDAAALAQAVDSRGDKAGRGDGLHQKGESE